MNLKMYPCSLKGNVKVPASKSITHRYLICAAFSNGKSEVHNPLICDDTLATISVLKQLGAKFKFSKDRIIVKGCGIPKIKDRKITILESATTLRMLLPLLVLFSSKLTITSTKRLVDRIYTSDLFSLRGFNFQRKDHSVTINGKLEDKNLVLSGKITTQLISGILIALPYLEEDTTLKITDITFDNPYLALTLDAMKKYGIKYEIDKDLIKVGKKQKYISRDTFVEADYSNGAVWLVASYFHREISITGLNLDSLQGDGKIVDYMKAMGIEFSFFNNTFTYNSGEIKPINLNVNETPDLAPILVSLASKALGTLIIRGTGKLKYKESNRKLAIMEVINNLGGKVSVDGDDIIIQGTNRLTGGVTIDSYNDHRIVMATAILSTICLNPVIIKDFQVVNKSYPEFFTDLAKLGARFEVQ